MELPPFNSMGPGSRACGVSNVPGTTVPRAMRAWTSATRIVYVWDGSTMALRASVSRLERARCRLHTVPWALIPRALRVSRRKVGQLDTPLIRDAATCGVTQ